MGVIIINENAANHEHDDTQEQNHFCVPGEAPMVVYECFPADSLFIKVMVGHSYMSSIATSTRKDQKKKQMEAAQKKA